MAHLRLTVPLLFNGTWYDHIKEAIAFHLDGMVQDSDPIPPQYTVLAVSVEVPVPAALALPADG